MAEGGGDDTKPHIYGIEAEHILNKSTCIIALKEHQTNDLPRMIIPKASK